MTKEEMKLVSETALNYPIGWGHQWLSTEEFRFKVAANVSESINKDKSLIEFG